MKKCVSLFIFFLTLSTLQSHAQFSRYIIRLTDKTGTPYSINNPSQFLTQRSIDRRIRYGIAIEETDLPIVPRYLDSIRLAGNVTILNVSKWLNQVCISTTDALALDKINSFDFVISSSAVAARTGVSQIPVNKQLDPPQTNMSATILSAQNTTDFYNYGSSYDQVHIHNAEFLHNYGFHGQGMQVAVIDDGFANYLTLPTFDSVRNSSRILGTWDFVANNNSVNEDDSHGMKCFSTIAANMPGTFVGTAPAASFYLYRTENIFEEYPVEEQNWAAAAERADSLGVDLFSVSVGYTTFDNSAFNHTYTDMNGNSTIIARAANLAAKKGILVVAAAGNDGNNSWHYISTLGDTDSALTIGAVNAARQVGSFSSYGPSSDGQIKPDVAAIGASATVASTNTGLPVLGNGTSYACPIMAGITTCLWQAFPEIKNMDIIEGIRKSGDRYTNPDDRSGYGIPDVRKAFVNFIKQLHTYSSFINECNVAFNISVKASEEMNIEIERKLPSDAGHVAVGTQTFTGAFAKRIFTYTDDLNDFTSGVTIQYRIKMNIGTDTSFYLDSTTIAYNIQCSEVTERKICPTAATYFSVNAMSGYTYKWQVDTGTGFTDITNNSFYSGAGSNVLIVNNLPQNFYGYKYRCVQTNGATTINSTPISLKFSSDWTGAVSTAWEDAGNWSCGVVPNQYIDANIHSGAVNFPVVNSNAVCHSLHTTQGAWVMVKSGFKLTVVGQ
ncbi:MAG: S8 family serine peptidase [Bacteroidota bacterium]